MSSKAPQSPTSVLEKYLATHSQDADYPQQLNNLRGRTLTILFPVEENGESLLVLTELLIRQLKTASPAAQESAKQQLRLYTLSSDIPPLIPAIRDSHIFTEQNFIKASQACKTTAADHTKQTGTLSRGIGVVSSYQSNLDATQGSLTLSPAKDGKENIARLYESTKLHIEKLQENIRTYKDLSELTTRTTTSYIDKNTLQIKRLSSIFDALLQEVQKMQEVKTQGSVSLVTRFMPNTIQYYRREFVVPSATNTLYKPEAAKRTELSAPTIDKFSDFLKFEEEQLQTTNTFIDTSLKEAFAEVSSVYKLIGSDPAPSESQSSTRQQQADSLREKYTVLHDQAVIQMDTYTQLNSHLMNLQKIFEAECKNKITTLTSSISETNKLYTTLKHSIDKLHEKPILSGKEHLPAPLELLPTI